MRYRDSPRWKLRLTTFTPSRLHRPGASSFPARERRETPPRVLTRSHNGFIRENARGRLLISKESSCDLRMRRLPMGPLHLRRRQIPLLAMPGDGQGEDRDKTDAEPAGGGEAVYYEAEEEVNYYNEWDKDAAAWLRELIRESGQVLLANSAFGQGAHGMSDREPKLCQAKRSWRDSSTPHFFRDQACVPSPRLCFRRTTRISSVHSDWSAENEAGLSLASVSPWCAGDIVVRAQDFSGANLGLFSQPVRGDTYRSRSTFGFGWAVLGIPSRMFGICGSLFSVFVHRGNANSIHPNNTALSAVLRRSLSHTSGILFSSRDEMEPSALRQ